MGVSKRILQNGRVRWYIQYKVDGKWFTETVPARNEKEARVMLGEKLGDIKHGRVYDLPGTKGMTLSKWSEKYLVIKENQGIEDMRRVRLSVKILNAHFGKRKLQEIKPSDVEAFKAKMLKTPSRKRPGHMLAGPTVNRLMAQLRNMYMVAKREGIIETNPVCGIKFEKEHGRNRVITDREF